MLKAKPDDKSESDSAALERVQRATEAEIERYRAYGSATEAVADFKHDLTSSAAKKVHGELRHLKLPSLPELRDRFEERAQALGVGKRA